MARRPLAPGTYGKISVVTGELDEKGKAVYYIGRAQLRERTSGRVLTVTARGRSKAGAEGELRKKLDERDDRSGIGGLTPVSKVSQLADLWFERKSLEKKVTASTLAAYRQALDSHVIPGLGELSVKLLHVQAIDAFLVPLAERTPSQAHMAKVCIRAMVRLAVAYQALPNDFSSSLFAIPKPDNEIQTLTESQVLEVLGAIDTWRTGPGTFGPRPTHRLGDVFRLQLGAALRIGEALALRVCDVFPPTSVGGAWRITVAGTIIAPRTGGVYRQPFTKSSNGMRTIPVTGIAAEVLARLLIENADAPGEQLLFLTSRGTPVQPGNVRRQWIAIRDSLEGHEGVVPHTLRKTMATLLAKQISKQFAALYIGHGNSTNTLDQYYFARSTVVEDPNSGLFGVLESGKLELEQ